MSEERKDASSSFIAQLLGLGFSNLYRLSQGMAAITVILIAAISMQCPPTPLSISLHRNLVHVPCQFGDLKPETLNPKPETLNPKA